MPFPEYVAVVQAERERQAARDHLAAFAARVRNCCRPSRLARILKAIRREPARCR